ATEPTGATIGFQTLSKQQSVAAILDTIYCPLRYEGELNGLQLFSRKRYSVSDSIADEIKKPNQTSYWPIYLDGRVLDYEFMLLDAKNGRMSMVESPPGLTQTMDFAIQNNRLMSLHRPRLDDNLFVLYRWDISTGKEPSP